MNLNERIEAFAVLGNKIGQLINDANNQKNQEGINYFLSETSSNEWYTWNNIKYALNSISKNLTIENLNLWLETYPDSAIYNNKKKIGLVTAGNIPLVGFHDVLCILIGGHELVIKHSSKDEKLMNKLLNILIDINPEFKKLIHVEKKLLKGFDAVIATGSDNTSKYFEYYFAKYPHIIRKNRNSVAVLTGNETDHDLKLLADDMLLYFGLGCRNVSKLYIPDHFDIQRIFKAVSNYSHLIDHHKYANNFTYNRTIYLMSKIAFLENGFLILKEDLGMASPISVIFFERYSEIEKIKDRMILEQANIQCIVASNGIIEGSIEFGLAQEPKLWNYADNVDTMKFLFSLV